MDYTRHDTKGGGKGGYGKEEEEEEWRERERGGRDGEEVGIFVNMTS